jgi:hypothetical protein
MPAFIATLFFFIARFVSQQPTLTRSVFSLFACKELSPGKSFFISDLSMSCESTQYYILKYVFGLPLLLLYVGAFNSMGMNDDDLCVC